MTGYKAAVPAQTYTPKDAGGKHVSDFISKDTRIWPDGAVTGTLHYIDELESFGGKGGNFFPVTVTTGGEEITVEGDNGPITSTDTDWLIEVKSTGTKVTFQKGGVTFQTLTFADAKLEPKAVPLKAAATKRVARKKTTTG